MDDLREDPAASPIVSLWSRHGLWAGSAFPDAAGAYRLDRLAEDSYFVVASPSGPPEQGFSELYEDRLCVGGADPGCDPTEGTPVQVSSGAATSGIDLEVRDPRPFDCEPGPSRLCLNEGRFQVAVGWIDNPALEERARMEPLTADTAYSWFFRPDNVELLVKVLDACQPPFNRFWVFAAGLTNLDVTLRVVDSWTGEQYVHRSQGNVPFPPLLDTAAFATCAAQAPASAPTRRSPAGIVRARAPGAVDAGGGTCVPGPQRLCLQDGRFAIEAVWTTAGGQTGNGHAEPLTADTGTFWFFNPLNLELIVKVLDACQPPFDRFWVFAAGLTNVDVLLRVTDTSSGESWEHRNPQGVPFEPVLDTDAFSTCP